MVGKVAQLKKQRPGWLIAVMVVLWSFVAFYMARTVTQGIVWLLAEVGVNIESFNQTIVQTIVTAVVWVIALSIAIGVPYIVLRSKTTLKDLGLQRLPTWTEIGLAPLGYIASALAAAAIMAIMTQFVPVFDATQAQDVGFNALGMRFEYIIAFITLVIIVPIAEETFFRGYLYGKLKGVIPTWLAILIVSALFGAAHGQWNIAVVTFVMGIFLCILRDLTGSLWPAIMMHMIRNGIAFYGSFILNLALV